MTTIKRIKSIILVPVTETKLTVFNSAAEKRNFALTHEDADVYGNYALEPLYMLVDTEGAGYNLTPRRAVTYLEALTIINMYY